LALVTEGTAVELLGQLEDSSWVLVSLGEHEGWLQAEEVSYILGFDDLPIVEPPPAPTSPPIITITINNIGETPARMIVSNDTGQVKNVLVQRGQSASFTLTAGTYTFFVQVGGSTAVGCTKTLTVNTNLVWNAQGLANQVCYTFP
jgi:hypothetical protein